MNYSISQKNIQTSGPCHRYPDSETESFVSEKNGNIDSVQFVIKTDAIEKKVEKKAEETSVVEKFRNLFSGK